MTNPSSAPTPIAKKNLLSRIAVTQKHADAAKKTAKLAKLGLRNAKQKFKDARKAAKKLRKAVKALKVELAALSAKKPARRPEWRGSMPSSRAASARKREYEGVQASTVDLKSRMIASWRLVFPPDIGMTVAPIRRAP